MKRASNQLDWILYTKLGLCFGAGGIVLASAIVDGHPIKGILLGLFVANAGWGFFCLKIMQ